MLYDAEWYRRVFSKYMCMAARRQAKERDVALSAIHMMFSEESYIL